MEDEFGVGTCDITVCEFEDTNGNRIKYDATGYSENEYDPNFFIFIGTSTQIWVNNLKQTKHEYLMYFFKYKNK